MTTIQVPALQIDLAAGERYAGLLLDESGKPMHHLVLMAPRGQKLTWDAAVEFARQAGGELPTRREQLLLFANARDAFEPNWYWSSEQYEEDRSYAWFQYFYDGGQFNSLKSYEGRPVAVRRLPA